MSFWAFCWTALGTGFLGSLHCAAMCGPLATAGCARADGTLSAPAVSGYLFGRLASYSLAGAILGHLGQQALGGLPVSAVQLGAMAVVAAAFAWRGVRLWISRSKPSLVALRAPRRPGLGAFLVGLVPSGGLPLGLVTGILPCSMLLAAWALAASSESALIGAGMMAAFWMGSSPGVMAPLLGRPLWKRMAALSPRVQGAAWLALACWVAARPLLNAAHHHGP
jgi:sulfite exporter TauE/SafE